MVSGLNAIDDRAYKFVGIRVVKSQGELAEMAKGPDFSEEPVDTVSWRRE